MAETVGSVVVQEAVGQILSGLVQRYAESNASRNLERLEMAQIRLEAALETSEKWQITDTSLLRWRRKLKRAAQECDDTLRECKRRIREEEETEQEVRNSAFPKRIAHAAKSFVLSSFRRDGNELSRSAVQRFEWFADGASEFVRFVRFGGTPQQRMAFNSLIKHLLAGKKLQHKVARGHGVGGSLFLLCLAPVTTTEHGLRAIWTTFQMYLATEHLKNKWSVDSKRPQNSQLDKPCHLLLHNFSLVRILFLALATGTL